MEILHLNLYKEYFDLIAKGKKKTEYRDITPYWQKRIENRQYDEINFRNGYRKDAPFVRVEYLGYKKRKYYELKLGKILELQTS